MKRNLINTMLDTQNRLRTLPPPHDWRCFYTVNELTPTLGRRLCLHTAAVMLHLGWTRTVRKINGATKRVWFPPGVQTASLDDLDDISFSTTSTSNLMGGARNA